MEAVLGLIGVIVGFLLSELSQSWRARSRVARARSAITSELRSLQGKIPQLKDICNRAIKELRARTLLPTLAVPAMSSAYDAHIEELQAHLTVTERNCLHIIYSRLIVIGVRPRIPQPFRDDTHGKRPAMGFQELMQLEDAGELVHGSLISGG